MAINHLKGTEQQRIPLVYSFGLQAVSGTPTHSKVEGAAPSHQITAYNALGVGEWNACKGLWYSPGEEIPATDYHFWKGALATAMTSGAQQVDSFFPADVPHSGTAAIGYKAPEGLGNADVETNPPNGLKGIFETKKCLDFNSSGVQTDFSYSANPARCIVQTIFDRARMPNLPTSVWADYVAYWKSRIDWANYIDFRNFHAQTESVDYRTLTDFDGFGLRARYYSGTNFNTFITRFVHANFDINYGSQPPAANVAAGSFSGKFDGYIKFPTSETWTIYITVDNGTRLYLNSVLKIDQWSDDGLHSIGSYNTTYNSTANSFVPIEAHWNDGGVVGNFKMEWSSASQTRQVIPSKYLYPKEENQALYESHIFIPQASSLIYTIREILRVSNSIMQDVNGKLRFFCLEQLTPSFTLDNSNIDKFYDVQRRDILMRDPFTEYEGEFKDLDSQYLQPPTTPMSVQLQTFARKTFENVKVVPLYTNTRWRVKKILTTLSAMETGNDLLAAAETKMAKTYPITAGDLIAVTHRKVGATARNYLVKKIADSGVSESSDSPTGDVETRTLTLQEWGN